MEKMYHIGLDASHGARCAILPGDPGRVPAIAARLDRPRFLAENREYTSHLGFIEGEPVLVMSTGMGGPSTAIGVEELYRTGVRTVIRVGTCGGMAERVVGGDLVVAQASVRMEGTTREYVDLEYPACADWEVTNALVAAARGTGRAVHVGVVQSKDSFYGQHDPARMPAGIELMRKWDQWIAAGCLASEMESAALFVVSSVLGIRAGCVLSVCWNQERRKKGLSDPQCTDPSPAIEAAVSAVRRLILQQKQGGC